MVNQARMVLKSAVLCDLIVFCFLNYLNLYVKEKDPCRRVIHSCCCVLAYQPRGQNSTHNRGWLAKLIGLWSSNP
jgi:hypothetical protein